MTPVIRIASKYETGVAGHGLFHSFIDDYKTKLINPVLVDLAIPIIVDQLMIPAIPCDTTRTSGCFDLCYINHDRGILYLGKIFELLRDTPGFENLHYSLSINRTAEMLCWGNPAPRPESEYFDHKTLGKMYGYTDEAIADFIERYNNAQ